MRMLLTLLAVIGALGVLRLLTRSAFALARQKLESYVLRTVAQTRAQAGDLTALNEANELARQHQRLRRRLWGEFLGLVALLLVPTVTPYMLHIYTVYNAFWLLPLRTTRSYDVVRR